jgi:capsular exopolysaccharide synthesis family protein
LKTPEDVEFYAKLPFLGYVPLIRGKEKDRYLASNKDQFSITAEAFRNIKVSLLFSAPENKPAKSILVTSSNPKEGKSLVASNLATVFAQEGKPTLLIDADMRGGKLAGTFDIDITPGMSEVLSGNASVDEVIKETQVPNLSIIPSGVHIPNPIDILNTENFEKLFGTVSSRFEKIVIDIPSVLTFTDSLFWERKSDYLVMVIKSGTTQLKAIEEAKKKFIGKVSLAGAILNKTEITKDLKYYLHYFEKTIKNAKKVK